MGTATEMVGQVVPLGDSPREKGRSIAILVCHNVPEAVRTCRSSGYTSAVDYFRWMDIY